MKFFITKYTFNGVKNVDKPMTFIFHDKTIDLNDFPKEYSNVKAIYGENGSGKSAFIHSIDILKLFVALPSLLHDPHQKQTIIELINKRGHEMSSQIEFIAYSGKENKPLYKFGYEYCLQKKDPMDIEVAHEKLEILRVYTSNFKNKERVGKSGILFESKDGELINTSLPEKYYQLSMNLIDKMSMARVVYDEYFDSVDFDENHYNIQEDLCINLIRFVLSIRIYQDRNDDHSYYIYNLLERQKEQIGDGSNVDESEVYRAPISITTKRFHPKLLKEYVANIKRSEKFFKLLINDLVSLDYEVKNISSNESHIDIFFNYGDYFVHSEYESNGIKKLMNLYEMFSACENGEIVFIDELDSNIHDVLLRNLIEYFSDYGKGQLIFTTHNLGPMESLQNKKHAIDFLTNNREVYEWSRSGNYKVANLYKNGLFPNMPFNLEPEDFLTIFRDELV